MAPLARNRAPVQSIALLAFAKLTGVSDSGSDLIKLNANHTAIIPRGINVAKTGLQPIHKPDLPGEAFQNLADISKAGLLGWEPQVSLKEGLRLSIDYIRENVLNIKELTSL